MLSNSFNLTLSTKTLSLSVSTLIRLAFDYIILVLSLSHLVYVGNLLAYFLDLLVIIEVDSVSIIVSIVLTHSLLAC